MNAAIEMPLPRHRSCGATARRLIEERFRDQLSRDGLDDLKLVVSELVDNAYLHGRGQIRLKVTSAGGHILAEVMDEGEGAVIRIRQAGAIGGGNGLRLVDHLSLRWGAYQGSTHVWADVPMESQTKRSAY